MPKFASSSCNIGLRKDKNSSMKPGMSVVGALEHCAIAGTKAIDTIGEEVTTKFSTKLQGVKYVVIAYESGRRNPEM